MASKPPIRSHGRKAAAAAATPRDPMAARALLGAWTARVITLVPDAFPGVPGESRAGKALKDGRWQLETNDQRPFGGGAGMALRADVVARARHARRAAP